MLLHLYGSTRKHTARAQRLNRDRRRSNLPKRNSCRIVPNLEGQASSTYHTHRHDDKTTPQGEKVTQPGPASAPTYLTAEEGAAFTADVDATQVAASPAANACKTTRRRKGKPLCPQFIHYGPQTHKT